jgi:hypothetical protein
VPTGCSSSKRATSASLQVFHPSLLSPGALDANSRVIGSDSYLNGISEHLRLERKNSRRAGRLAFGVNHILDVATFEMSDELSAVLNSKALKYPPALPLGIFSKRVEAGSAHAVLL